MSWFVSCTRLRKVMSILWRCALRQKLAIQRIEHRHKMLIWYDTLRQAGLTVAKFSPSSWVAE